MAIVLIRSLAIQGPFKISADLFFKLWPCCTKWNDWTLTLTVVNAIANRIKKNYEQNFSAFINLGYWFKVCVYIYRGKGCNKVCLLANCSVNDLVVQYIV